MQLRGRFRSWLYPLSVAGLFVVASSQPLLAAQGDGHLIGTGDLTGTGRLSIFPEYTLYQTIPYGKEKRQQLDIYVPAKPNKANSVIVFFHGGAWKVGNKRDFAPLALALNSLGHTVVVANYRLYPDVSYPTFMQDGAKAVSWVIDNIKGYGGDPSHLYLAGHSAGAFIAVMLGFNDSYLREAGKSPSQIKGILSLSCPYDLRPENDPLITDIFTKAPRTELFATAYAGPGKPPLLIVAGGDDEEFVRSAHLMTKKMQKTGGAVEEIIYPGNTHDLVDPISHKAPLLYQLDDFITRHGGS